MTRWALLLLALPFGCRNAVYYAETDRIGIALEQKPDVTQPVAFNLGFKQRVIAVVPSMREGATADVDVAADAMSVLSRFDFDYEDGTGFRNPTLVQSALITGRAAAQLDEKQAAEAYSALNSGSGAVRTHAFTSMSLAYSRMEEIADPTSPNAGDEADRALAARYLDAARTDSLRLLIGLEPFSKRTLNFTDKTLADTRVPVAAPDHASVTSQDAFTALAQFRGELAEAVHYYEEWAKVQAPPIDLGAKPGPRTGPKAEAEQVAWQEARSLAAQLSALDAQIGKAPGLVQLVKALDFQLRTGRLPALQPQK